MSEYVAHKEHEITAGGGTIDLDLSMPYYAYYFFSSGSVTLTGSWSLNDSGAPQKGMEIKIRWRADVDLNGNSVTIFGWSVPSQLANKNFNVTLYYNGSSWETEVELDYQEDLTISEDKLMADSVITSKIKDKNVTKDKFEDISQGAVLTGDSSNRPTEILNKDAAHFLIGDGTKLTSSEITGDVTIDKNGNATIPSSTISRSQLNFSLGDVLLTTVKLSSSEVNNIGSSPITVLKAQGTNTGIDVISAQAKLVYNGSSYTLSSETLDLVINNITLANFSNSFITSDSTVVEMADLKGQVNIAENTALQVTTSGGTDPGGGADGQEIILKVMYKPYTF